MAYIILFRNTGSFVLKKKYDANYETKRKKKLEAKYEIRNTKYEIATLMRNSFSFAYSFA